MITKAKSTDFCFRLILVYSGIRGPQHPPHRGKINKKAVRSQRFDTKGSKGRCLTRDTLYLFIISVCVYVGRSVCRHVSKRSSRAWESGGTEPIIPLLYILGKERQIYINISRTRYICKISNLLLSENQRAARKSIKRHLLFFFNNASNWDRSRLFE